MPDTEELKEKELEKVAGGDFPCFTMSGTAYQIAVSVQCPCWHGGMCNNPNKPKQ